jgi:hypothetical protein
MQRRDVMLRFPNGSAFAFTVYDDTDRATVENIKPIYDLLWQYGFRTTKSVWVYPPRGAYRGSSSLQDPEYVAFIRDLQAKGFEIGLHSVGDGYFSRSEILAGIESFKEILGHYPAIHANHVSNPDSLYWWDKRFEWPVNVLYRLLSRRKPRNLGGENPSSDVFWGDVAKRHIRYIRNQTFNDINTSGCDPRMPYRIERTKAYCNCWFSSSDGQTVEEFTDLISRQNVDRIADSGGACIVYTHFAAGFVDKTGQVNEAFHNNLRYLAHKGGWFVPVSQLLDHLALKGTDDPGYLYRLGTNIRWGQQRLVKKLRYER